MIIVLLLDFFMTCQRGEPVMFNHKYGVTFSAIMSELPVLETNMAYSIHITHCKHPDQNA